MLNAKIPNGPIEEKWDNHRFNLKLINPANKRNYTIIVIGTGLAGASASASMAELGYNIKTFCIQDSPRRAHSIAAQGGINAAKNYQNDGDSIKRLFYDTIKGGDFRSREANVYRLAQISNNIIDQCVAQGVPFAREYGGALANRSFGGAQVSRTFYARGQTGQQLLLGAYGALLRQIAAKKVTMFIRREMLDIVIINKRARGIIVRNLETGKLERYKADAVVLASGGYGNAFFLSTNAMSCNVSGTYAAYKKGAYFANPCFTQIHPTCIPISFDHQSKLTLMSESLRNDGRVWVPKNLNDKRSPDKILENERDYFLERKYPSFGNLVPRDVASRNIKRQCDLGKGKGETGQAVYLDFNDAIKRDGNDIIEKKYGNLFHMYEKITGDNPYKTPMMIYPASHYTMGGLWVDYNLMSNLSGLFVIGEANFSDHGANRLGASALMQGLADGYFILPCTIGGYLYEMNKEAIEKDEEKLTVNHLAFKKSEDIIRKKIDKLLSINGTKSCDDFHKKLGKILWDSCSMSRNEKDLVNAKEKIITLCNKFWKDVKVTGKSSEFNQNLERTLRVADFMEFNELMVIDALNRKESCGCHFNESFQTKDGETKRDDENYRYVAAWEYKGYKTDPVLHKEKLLFDDIKLTQRNYK